MSERLIAWSIFLLFYALPLAHVALSRRAGPWRAQPEARCPFGPRAGWLIMVVFLGPLGWVLFWTRRRVKS